MHSFLAYFTLVVICSLATAFHQNEKLQRSSLDTRHKVLFVVKSSVSDAQIEEELMKVSDPKSPSYGKHWKKVELEDFKRNPESTKVVRDFLASHDGVIEEVSDSKDGADLKIWASAPRSLWETLFAAEFWDYRSVNTGNAFARSTSYNLPKELVDHVDAVLYINDFPSKIERHSTVGKPLPADFMERKKASEEEEELGSNQFTPNIFPDFLRTFLKVADAFPNQGDYSALKNLGLSQMIYSSLNESYQPTALQNFLAATNSISDPEIEYLGVPGYNTNEGCVDEQQCNSYESSLDIQYMTAIAQGIKTYYYADDYADEGSFLLSFTNYLMTMSDSALPNVVSISYGAPEIGQVSQTSDGSFIIGTASPGNIQAEKNFKELGLRGTTIVVSSGDNGAPGDLVANTEINLGCGVGYEPVWPASSPWVTAVGAVQGPEMDEPAVVCDANKGGVITSGGGFSLLYPRPSYQSSYASAYLSKYSVPPSDANPEIIKETGYGNSGYKSGNGYPDVANLGHNYVIFVLIAGNITQIPVSGTSASAPVTAAMLSLANALRLQTNTAVFGYANPALYSYDTSVFVDITSGNNNCTEETCCQFGYEAEASWDAATGRGIPFIVGDGAAPTASPTAPPTASPTRSSTGGGGSSNSSAGTNETAMYVGVIFGGLTFFGLVAFGIWYYFKFMVKAANRASMNGASGLAPAAPAPAASAAGPVVANPMAATELPSLATTTKDVVPPPGFSAEV